MNTIKNALSVDVEDYYHVSAFSRVLDKNDWDNLESRVYENTLRLLDLFDSLNIKSTFFVLGIVAERYPEIVREISLRNHEIACHGYSHDMITNQTRAEFEKETRKAKDLIEQQSQSEVLGYRAASFSVTNSTLWALDILEDIGFKYDSSVFPIHHDRYGIPDAPSEPYKIRPDNESLVEFPMTVKRFGRLNVPVSGGGYFRIYPYFLTKSLLRNINNNEKRPFVFYLHPWEIDKGQPRINAGKISNFRHYTNIHKCEYRLKSLIKDFSFTTIQNTLEDLNLL